MLSKSVANGRRLGVTFYNSSAMAFCTYCGSTLWFLLLVLFDGLMLGSSNGMWSGDGFDATAPFLSIVLAFNIALFGLQTVDAVLFDHTFWPIQALKWSFELFNIAALAAVTGFAFATGDSHRSARIGATGALLYAQCLFTASSLSLTLEYLHRAAAKCG